MRVVRFTPHPCAAILREYTYADEWCELVERRNVFRWELNNYKDELAKVRSVRKVCRDPVDALAADRRTVLRYLSVHPDEEMKSLWECKGDEDDEEWACKRARLR